MGIKLPLASNPRKPQMREPPHPQLHLDSPPGPLFSLACSWGPRAINNGLLDTYQLKSLDGLLESDLEYLALVKDSKGKLHITLKFLLEENNSSQSADSIPLPQDENDNFAMRVAYDRVIRCLGWKFDFSIFNQ